eukprot:TRINITY_DN10123_c1_g1_i1.p1 TRINITY_DN10123_c1_g1~~TRINITY_DN10123_c1_g1_i1.p1  ORF type:complete len:1037 (-),score=175.23 TRINITY_DN10123_c1_g1_i1:208-3318(-)
MASEYENSLSVRSGSLEIHMQNMQLDNAGAERWCAWARQNVPELLRQHNMARSESDSFLAAREINFSNNNIGDRGAHAILRALFSLKIGARVLKLFKNCLGRAAASALMDWLVATPVAVFELHLSHNWIPREGAVDILKAIAYNTAYPYTQTGKGKVPMWLRLEMNTVSLPDTLLQVADEQMKKIRTASGTATTVGPMLCDGKEGAGCRSDFCILSRPDGHCPLAQLTYLQHQRDSRARAPAEAQSWQADRPLREEAARWRMMMARDGKEASGSPRTAAPGSSPTAAANAALDDAGAAAAALALKRFGILPKETEAPPPAAAPAPPKPVPQDWEEEADEILPVPTPSVPLAAEKTEPPATSVSKPARAEKAKPPGAVASKPPPSVVSKQVPVGSVTAPSSTARPKESPPSVSAARALEESDQALRQRPARVHDTKAPPAGFKASSAPGGKPPTKMPPPSSKLPPAGFRLPEQESKGPPVKGPPEVKGPPVGKRPGPEVKPPPPKIAAPSTLGLGPVQNPPGEFKAPPGGIGGLPPEVKGPPPEVKAPPPDVKGPPSNPASDGLLLRAMREKPFEAVPPASSLPGTLPTSAADVLSRGLGLPAKSAPFKSAPMGFEPRSLPKEESPELDAGQGSPQDEMPAAPAAREDKAAPGTQIWRPQILGRPQGPVGATVGTASAGTEPSALSSAPSSEADVSCTAHSPMLAPSATGLNPHAPEFIPPGGAKLPSLSLGPSVASKETAGKSVDRNSPGESLKELLGLGAKVPEVKRASATKQDSAAPAICQSCSKVLDDSRFCRKCGTKQTSQADAMTGSRETFASASDEPYSSLNGSDPLFAPGQIGRSLPGVSRAPGAPGSSDKAPGSGAFGGLPTPVPLGSKMRGLQDPIFGVGLGPFWGTSSSIAAVSSSTRAVRDDDPDLRQQQDEDFASIGIEVAVNGLLEEEAVEGIDDLIRKETISRRDRYEGRENEKCVPLNANSGTEISVPEPAPREKPPLGLDKDALKDEILRQRHQIAELQDKLQVAYIKRQLQDSATIRSL